MVKIRADHCDEKGIFFELSDGNKRMLTYQTFNEAMKLVGDINRIIYEKSHPIL